jgi:hypothetical protein
MSTTPTLRDAAQAVIDATADETLNREHLDALEAALTQGAGEAVEWEDWTPEVESRFRELSDEAEVWLALRSDPSFPARAYWNTTDNRFHNLDDGYLERSANITHVMPRRHPDTPMRIAAIRAKGTHD